MNHLPRKLTLTVFGVGMVSGWLLTVAVELFMCWGLVQERLDKEQAKILVTSIYMPAVFVLTAATGVMWGLKRRMVDIAATVVGIASGFLLEYAAFQIEAVLDLLVRGLLMPGIAGLIAGYLLGFLSGKIWHLGPPTAKIHL